MSAIHALNRPLAFDLMADGYKSDPWPALAAIRQAGVVVPMKLPIIGKVWLTTTHAATLAMVKDSDAFVRRRRTPGQAGAPSRAWWVPRSVRLLGDNLLAKDDPDHRRLRRLVDHAFARRDILALRERIAEIADRVLDRLDPSGDVDLVAAYCNRLPLEVICELLGLPDADRDEFASWSRLAATLDGPLAVWRTLGAVNRMAAYLRGQIEACRRTPGKGLIGELVRAREDGDSLSEDELVSMVLMLLVAGFETTTNLIGASIMTLEQNPVQKAWLLADPASRMERAVEELARHITPVQLTGAQFAARDMEFHGQDLRRGQPVMGLLASANTDPAVFDAAERLMLDRFPNPHLVFSSGVHFCLGMQLARLEVQSALARLYDRFPRLEIVAPERIEWTRRIGFRGPKSLVVRLGRPAGRLAA
jgi:cytochrome P450